MPGIIKINPGVLNDNRDALAVAWNEALRLAMEDMKFKPVFDVTPEQRDFFADTAYADDESALRKTIVARIATHDTSVSPTEEQEGETVRLLDLVAEMIGTRHRDYKTVTAMRESVLAGNARGAVRAAAAGAAAAMAATPAPAQAEAGAPPEAPAQVEAEAQAEAEADTLTQAADAAGDVRAPASNAPATNAPPVSTSVKARALNYVKGAKPEMEAVVDRVVDALIPAEGFAENDTVGDKGRALGSLQMWEVAVEEANRIVGRKLWTAEDRKDPALARAMAKTILSFHYRRGVTDPVELGSKWRNPYGEEAPEWYKAKIRKALAGQ